jgi:hypothetical protein
MNAKGRDLLMSNQSSKERIAPLSTEAEYLRFVRQHAQRSQRFELTNPARVSPLSRDLELADQRLAPGFAERNEVSSLALKPKSDDAANREERQ